MQNNYLYFLTVAEELNISRAAKKLFVSQQCLSSHIKKLEAEYNSTLLNRKPALSLTPAGKALVEMLKQVRNLENNLRRELGNSDSAAAGYLKVGIHSVRSELFGGDILTRFWDEFPNITVSFLDGTTSSFEYLLAKGELDMYIGVNPVISSNHVQIPLFSEKIYLAVTDNFLKKHFLSKHHNLPLLLSEGIDLAECQDVPLFMTNASQSTLTTAIANHITNVGIRLNIRLYSSNATLRNSLAAMDCGAAVCVESRKNWIETSADPKSAASRGLHFLPIKGLDFKNNVYLIYPKGAYQPKYFTGFINILKECLGGSK